MPLSSLRLKQNIVLLKPDIFQDFQTLIAELQDQFSAESCPNIILDLTEFDFINSVRIGVLASTYHFTEFLSGKMYIIVNSRQAKKSIDTLRLNNTEVIYNQNHLVLDNIA